jgi:hypothetical protein
MTSNLVISAVPKPNTTVPGPDAALVELKDVVYRRAELFPNDGHSASFHRQQLSGEKGMPVTTFDRFLERVARRFGLETVRRIGNRWFAKYGMHLVDLSNVVTVKTPDDEILEASKAVSHLVVKVDAFGIDGYDDQERREIRRNGDQAIAEIRDVVEAACR